MNEKTRVLIGSPVKQDFKVLSLFLDSLKDLEKDSILIDYFFIDDNDTNSSTDLLHNFSAGSERRVKIEQGNNDNKNLHMEKAHQWKEEIVWKVAEYKNRIIEYSKKEAYDYLFLVDSDLVLHPKTLQQLISANNDIISEIFWTKWRHDHVPLPQVWLYDHYALIPKKRLEIIDQAEADKRYTNFIAQLRRPGVYEVGGLGACTLISRKALNAGINFNEIYNISFWGEDRHFCIRAAALGFRLYVETTFPAYHIYREEDLDGAIEFRNRCKNNISLRTEINSLVREFIEGFFSCDYRVTNKFPDTNHLSIGYINRFNENKNSIDGFLNAKKAVCCTSLTDITGNNILDFDTRLNLDCTFEIKGELNEKSFTQMAGCRLMLEKQGSGSWLICDIELKNHVRKPLLGFSLPDLLEGKERINKAENNKLTLMMLVRNESGKFLRKMLAHARQYIDEAVILDDASDDDTVQVCREALSGIPLTLVSNKEHGFNNEIVLRKQLWQLTAATNPDWILCLDADEIFEDAIINNIKLLINQPGFDHYSFRLYDMWEEDHYREDKYWQAHKYYRVFLLRYQPNFNYCWNETPLHCGRIPQNIYSLPGCICYTRLKHFGWSTEKLREEKYQRYLTLDPEAKFGIKEQYESILDKNPVLIKWE